LQYSSAELQPQAADEPIAENFTLSHFTPPLPPAAFFAARYAIARLSAGQRAAIADTLISPIR